MAHNPPRPPNPGPEAARKLMEQVRNRPPIPYSSYAELADMIEGRVKAGKRVILLPETALIVARVLREAKS